MSTYQYKCADANLPHVDVVLGTILLTTASFVSVLLSAPYIGRKLGERMITSPDLHKMPPREIPSTGGLSLVLGFSVALALAGTLTLDPKPILVVFIVGILAALLGLVDDLLNLSKKTLFLASLAVGVPFVTYQVGSTIVTLAPFGPRDFGTLFWPLALLGVAFLSNAVNIYAGFNGLEAGLGFITSLSLAVCAAMYGSTESAVLLFVLGAGLLAFLPYNTYPARVFIGNTGTYLVGACIASSIIVGDIKAAGLIACTPYILNSILRAYDRLRWSVGETTPDGRVVSHKMNALWGVFMYGRPTSERSVVLKCWLIQVTFGVLAILYSLKSTMG